MLSCGLVMFGEVEFFQGNSAACGYAGKHDVREKCSYKQASFSTSANMIC